VNEKIQQSAVIEEDFARYIAKKNGLTLEEALARVRDGSYPKAPVKTKKMRAAALNPFPPKKKPLTTAQRIAKRLGPDDARYGGNPFMQGGSPGLGKRR
jgi:hypothetical protein